MSPNRRARMERAISQHERTIASRLTEELGDWRNSLQELNVLTSEDINES